MIGALIIDKPEGLTSHDVVSRVRRAAATRRVGHAGTLDPFATGVLVVCIGRATRLVQFLVGLDKEYTATVRLGFATDTQDLTGKRVGPIRPPDGLSADDLRRALGEFTGPLMQLPPMYSAKKIGGERLYRAAREGREVERAPVPVTIHSIELIGDDEARPAANEDGTRDFVMRVRCSSGTYVRTLAHDIGDKLGAGAHLAALRRCAVGEFRIEGALTLEEVQLRAGEAALGRYVVTPSDMLGHLPPLILDEERARRVLNGREFSVSAEEALTLQRGGYAVRLCGEKGELIAVGDYAVARQIVKPRVVLHDTV